MNDKLQKDIRAVEDAHAEAAELANIERHLEEQKARAMFVLGGIHIADRVSATLSSEAVKAMITFQNEEMYRALGFQRMVDFLNESEYSPMSKNQFYDRKELLEKEGERLFDLLTELGVSMRKRKLLGQGNVEINPEAGTLLVKTGDEQTEIALTDRTRLLETLSALADANADKTAKLDKQKAAIETHDAKVRELYNEIDRVRAEKQAEFQDDDHSLALVTLGLSFRQLIEAVEQMTEIEREQFAPRDLERIAGWMTDLSIAFGRGPDWTKGIGSPHVSKGSGSDGVVADELDAVIAQALDAADTDQANDRELAAKL